MGERVTSPTSAALKAGEGIHSKISTPQALPDGYRPVFDHHRSRQTVFCSRLCRGPPVPNELQQLAQTYLDDIERLWNAGGPVESDIRYMLVRATTNQPPALGAFDWPLSEATFTAAALTAARAADAPYGSGHLAQGADAVAFATCASGIEAVTSADKFPSFQSGLLMAAGTNCTFETRCPSKTRRVSFDRSNCATQKSSLLTCHSAADPLAPCFSSR
jgi:hypothetical protein